MIFIVIIVVNYCSLTLAQELLIFLGCNPDISDCSKFGDGANCMVTMSGCRCLDTWYYGNKAQSGCSNPDDSPRGNWCEFEPGSCTSKSHSKKYEYCHPNCVTVPLVQQSYKTQVLRLTTTNFCPLMVEGKDYTGADIMPPIIVADAIACQKICGLSRECKFFTFDKDDNQLLIQYEQKRQYYFRRRL
eukprot:TRINITY_DN7709_c0_g1_i11.p2 TRINITY_DN7709_c0_g1~~TRINITY_DN7709_c0_g1_i11.p2  ORF type:complete len:188 (-),score=8.73 TRINITY_DN7709_c0_g1_i11:206-769(-)